jgi:hypothetical protein
MEQLLDFQRNANEIEEIYNKLNEFKDQMSLVNDKASIDALLQDIQNYTSPVLNLRLINVNGQVNKYDDDTLNKGKQYKINKTNFGRTYSDFIKTYENLKRRQKEINFVKIAATALKSDGTEVNPGLPNRDKACQPPPYVSSDEPIVYTLQPAYLTINPNPDSDTPHIIDNRFLVFPNINMIIFEIFIKIYDFTHDNIKKIDRITEVDIGVGEERFGRIFVKTRSGGAKFSEMEKNETDYKFDISLMREDFSFILTQVLDYTAPVLVKEIREAYYTPNEYNKEKETEIFSDNEILLICFIIVTNKLFTFFTSYSSNDCLTNFYPTNILIYGDGQVKIDGLEPVSNKDPKRKIKIMKLSFIQTLLEGFYGTYGFQFDNTTQNIFNLFSPENNNFNLFFDMFLGHFVENYRLLNINEEISAVDNNAVDNNAIDNNAIDNNAVDNNAGIGIDTKLDIGSYANFDTNSLINKTNDTKIGSGGSKNKIFYGGKPPSKVIQNLLRDMFNELATKKQQQQGGPISININTFTKFLNSNILRVFVCNLLTSLGILKKPSGTAEFPQFKPGDITQYILTDFGNSLISTDRNINISNFRENDPNGFTMPTNGNRHPTKAIIEDMLKQLRPIWDSESTKPDAFSRFADFEHGFEYKLYTMAVHDYDMLFAVPELKQVPPPADPPYVGVEYSLEDMKRMCCPNKFIVDNASTVLDSGGSRNYETIYPQLKTHLIKTFPGILDPAGTIKIIIDDSQEYGEIDCIVLGKKLNLDNDNRVEFQGIINFEETPVEYPRNDILKNVSTNTIDTGFIPINASCNVIIPYPSHDTVTINNMEIDFFLNGKGEKEGIFIDIDTNNGNRNQRIGPENPTLGSCREYFINLIIGDLITDYNAHNNNVFENYYDNTNMKKINRLFAGTLNKTLGDLMQILTVLVKFGGINSLHSFGKDVMTYNNQGDGFRMVSHHDLTASVITYFLLIFGEYVFELNEQGIWKNKNYRSDPKFLPYINSGKNKGGFMNDHNLVRFAVGNFEDVNEVLLQFNASQRALALAQGDPKYHCTNNLQIIKYGPQHPETAVANDALLLLLHQKQDDIHRISAEFDRFKRQYDVLVHKLEERDRRLEERDRRLEEQDRQLYPELEDAITNTLKRRSSDPFYVPGHDEKNHYYQELLGLFKYIETVSFNDIPNERDRILGMLYRTLEEDITRETIIQYICKFCIRNNIYDDDDIINFITLDPRPGVNAMIEKKINRLFFGSSREDYYYFIQKVIDCVKQQKSPQRTSYKPEPSSLEQAGQKFLSVNRQKTQAQSLASQVLSPNISPTRSSSLEADNTSSVVGLAEKPPSLERKRTFERLQETEILYNLLKDTTSLEKFDELYNSFDEDDKFLLDDNRLQEIREGIIENKGGSKQKQTKGRRMRIKKFTKGRKTRTDGRKTKKTYRKKYKTRRKK